MCGLRRSKTTEVSRLVRERVAALQQAQRPVSEKEPETVETTMAVVPVSLAYDLVYEVGWESRHVFLDVRDSGSHERGRPKGAVSVVYGDDFVRRAKHVPDVAEHGRVVVGGDAETGHAAAEDLRHAGLRPVVLEKGWWTQWRQQFYPIDVHGLGDDDDDLEDDDGDPSKW